jgi:hypothetical protein
VGNIPVWACVTRPAKRNTGVRYAARRAARGCLRFSIPASVARARSMCRKPDSRSAATRLVPQGKKDAADEVEGKEDCIDDPSHEALSRFRAMPGVECLVGGGANPIEVLERRAREPSVLGGGTLLRPTGESCAIRLQRDDGRCREMVGTRLPCVLCVILRYGSLCSLREV